ncbi:MAG TPA: SBBP repeat-containing protein [Candidatus Acidoferrum sp.]|jgi:hypothetical protein|nr:SBBP repeat-containing protein [Candidatus Acidoferrum sp.]
MFRRIFHYRLPAIGHALFRGLTLSARLPCCRLTAIVYLVLFLPLTLAAFAAASTASGALAGLPLSFEPNHGQVAGPARFLARGEQYQFLLGPAGVQFVLWKQDRVAPASPLQPNFPPASSLHARAARMEFIGANRDAGMQGADELPGKINYFLGNDSQRWHTGVPTFSRVQVAQLYPGIDLCYYGNPRQLEYDFELAPRTDPALISIRFDGVDALSLSPAGDLVLTLGDDQLRHQRPALYQLVGGRRRDVSGHYRIKDQHTVGFVVGPYDRDLPLVIDPTFSYSTYFGGNNGDAAYSVKVDANGSVYIAGATLSTSFLSAIPTNAFQTNFDGGKLTGDAFVAKLDSTGSTLLYFTYLGGSSEDVAYDLALDVAGNAYLTGTTGSTNFPTVKPLFPTIGGTANTFLKVFPNDAFVAELNTNGSALVFSTYLGGEADDVANGIALDPAGNIYVTGFTDSTNFPVVNALQSTNALNDDAFVVKIAPGGTNLVYSTFLGGTASDRGESIAADENGFAYVTGYTLSTNFPYANGFQSTNSGTADAFVTRLNPNGTLAYSTYLGGSFNDFATRIVLDPAGKVLIAGATDSTNFPPSSIPGGFHIGNNGTNAFNYDIFLARFDTNGNLLATTLFGGSADDAPWGLAVDPSGRIFVAGTTFSFDFPVTNVSGLFSTNTAGSRDVFVTALSADAATPLYSGYLGGFADDFAYGIAVDAESSAYVTGVTSSTNFPTASAYQTSLSGPSDAFLAKIRLFNPNLSAALVGGNLVLRWPVTSQGYVLQSALALTPPVLWTNVPQAPVLAQGFYTVTLGLTNPFSAFRLSK